MADFNRAPPQLRVGSFLHMESDSLMASKLDQTLYINHQGIDTAIPKAEMSGHFLWEPHSSLLFPLGRDPKSSFN